MSAVAWAQSPDLDRLEAESKARDERIRQISGHLTGSDVPDATLESDLRALIEFQEQIQGNAQALSDALDLPTETLKQLGPPPATDAPPEPADVAALRESLNDDISRLTGLIKESVIDRGDVRRLIKSIRELQGRRYLSDVVSRSTWPFASKFWTDAAAEMPPTGAPLMNHVGAWWQDLWESGRWRADLALLAAALGGAIAVLLAPRWPRWRAFEAAHHANPRPSAMDKRRRVSFMAISRGALAAAAAALLYAAAVVVGLVAETGQVFSFRLAVGFAAFALVRNFAREVFSSRDERWRTVDVDSSAARRLEWLCLAIFCLYALDRILAAGFELAGAGPQLHLTLVGVATGLSMVLLWLLIGVCKRSRAAARRARDLDGSSGSSSDSASPTTSSSPEPMHTWTGLLLPAVRVLAFLTLAAMALGYVALAGFVFHRFVLLALFLILLSSFHALTLWALNVLPFVADTPVQATGQDQEKRRLGPWLSVAADAALLALGIPLFLLTVGYGWLDVQSWFEALSSDIQVGAISLSFSNIFVGILAFFAISLGTRWVTSIADSKVLARTGLGEGERNSVVTLVKYAGIVVGFIVALTITGVSLSKLMIVAGGLSVGIGLGLQGVVNNFVSGLILLFERPIQVGDWIEVSSGDGYVRHIGARATEIETFDRASIIIPNADLVTSSVQNWFYKNRVGRVHVAVSVSYGADPEQVRTILLGVAATNRSIRRAPAPQVLWMEFGDSSLDFALRAYVSDIDNRISVASDLRFEIFKALSEAGIEIPFPQRDLHIRSDDTKVDDEPV